MYKRVIRRMVSFIMALIVLSFSLSGCGGRPVTYDFTKEQRAMYDKIIEEQSKWIAERQLSDGAIVMYKADAGMENTVNPYFATQACMGLLEAETGYDCVKNYLQWHFEHINVNPDKLGIIGSIYDYSVNPNTQMVVSKDSYDSVDSYAANGLIVAQQYCEKTGDKEFLLQYQDKIALIINAMLSMEDNGLMWCKPDYQVKYLMDNSEVAAGFDSAAWIYENAFGNKPQAKLYEEKRNAIINKIETEFWMEEEKEYFVAISQTQKTKPNMAKLYPDGASQLLPGIFDIIKADSERNRVIQEKFNENQAEWTRPETSQEPWCIIAYSYALSGEYDLVNEFLLNMTQVYLKQGYVYPWHCGEAGFVLKAAANLREAAEK